MGGFADASSADISFTSISCASSTDAELRVEFTADATIESYQAPERSGNDVVLRFPNATVKSGALNKNCVNANASITQKRIRNFLVFRVRASKFKGSISAKRNGPKKVVLTIGASSAAPSQPSAKGWELDVIVIDAGHGGRDVGAIGVDGTHEKKVTLQIAKRLRDLVRTELPNTKVVMTRDDDRFIALAKRTEIANKAKGKLFISIHCNSMPKIPHPAHGCETYILRPGRNEEAARVARRENASIKLEKSQSKYSSMTEDELIMATMAQRSFVRYSEEFAKSVQKRVSRASGLTDRGVAQAGFYVLVGASMPNILFETAFLSNKKDAKVLTSSSGQEKIARGMLQAIKDYAAFYKKSIGG